MVGVGTTSPMESAFGSIAALAQPYEMLSLLKGVWLEQACDSGSLVAGSISLHQTALKVSALNSRCPCMAAVKARRIVVDHCLRWLSHFLVESPNCVAHIIAVQSAHMCLAAIFFLHRAYQIAQRSRIMENRLRLAAQGSELLREAGEATQEEKRRSFAFSLHGLL